MAVVEENIGYLNKKGLFSPLALAFGRRLDSPAPAVARNVRAGTRKNFSYDALAHSSPSRAQWLPSQPMQAAAGHVVSMKTSAS
jgi:hypothetical protein